MTHAHAPLPDDTLLPTDAPEPSSTDTPAARAVATGAPGSESASVSAGRPAGSPAATAPSTGQVNAESDADRIAALGQARDRILREVKKRIVGQDDAIELLLVTLFARGHGLFVGVPGLAKTLLITTLGEALSLDTSRIQFTPDLMPSDITGTDVLEEGDHGKRAFRFVKGPVFTHILLADEINRTPPKTQAALLQAMAEGRVTAGSSTYLLPPPFAVFATQNPIEQEGTYPLPEAQLDRFLLQIDMAYPSEEDEVEIVRRTTSPITEAPKAVLSLDEILALQALVPRVPIADHVVRHAVALVRATRPDAPSAPDAVREYVTFGAGPRASQALVLGAKARAALDGRFAAETTDVRAIAKAVLRHRLVVSFRAESEGVRPDTLIDQLLESIRP
ncbi:MAG: MoxR family ATPase [Polyangiales bacterium]